jgi:hypothetical protein
MVKLDYTDEVTFKTEEIEFSDEHYEIAKELWLRFGTKKIPIMVKNDKKSLIFCIDKSEDSGENDIYRIIVEKI